jgi:hypothetical protein
MTVEPKTVLPGVAPPVTGVGLSSALSGTTNERDKEEKTIKLTMVVGKKPIVEFTGFWSGALIRQVQHSIARAYRTRRHKVLVAVTQQRAKMEVGDASVTK